MTELSEEYLEELQLIADATGLDPAALHYADQAIGGADTWDEVIDTMIGAESWQAAAQSMADEQEQQPDYSALDEFAPGDFEPVEQPTLKEAIANFMEQIRND